MIIEVYERHERARARAGNKRSLDAEIAVHDEGRGAAALTGGPLFGHPQWVGADGLSRVGPREGLGRQCAS